MSLVQRFFRFAGTGTPPHSLRLGLAGVLALALSLPLAPRPASAQPDTVRAPYYHGYEAPRYRSQRIYRHAPRQAYRPYRPYRAYRPYRPYRAYRPYRPYPAYRPYPRYGSGVYFGYGGNGAAAAGIIGLATGLIAQQAIAPRRYYGPAPRRVYRGAPAWSPEWYAYCARKYRSFNPRTGYYLAYSGRYRFCR
ncbi:BA14K family protein [Stappia stellulata]|uniref:BA14K family protein n=1 Tax=Stappia stellulata TaxID=71235 RepID=UPI001CD2D62C|nr:BA14K family protein [Stappia stellulata]MCA1243763.1 BA14K family protein [Stappia stellulata]